MGNLVVSENVTLDGVVQDPTGEEGFRLGGWYGQVSDRDRDGFAEVLFEEALGAAALLLGGRSYTWFAARWPSRGGAWADRLNDLPKYVVSTTVKDPGWRNSTVLTGDVVSEVTKLKQRVNGDIVVYASGQLVPTLLEHDLVDELRLMVFPVVLGSGKRLFGETTDKKPFRLADSKLVGDGIAIQIYERA